MADKIKLLMAVLVMVAGVVLFYLFGEQSQLFRVLGLLFAVIIAAAIASRTELGASTLEYGRGAVIEAKKVVWPTRKETMQTTLMVMVMVFVVGMILWMFDMFLAWAVKFLTGQGG